MTDIDWRRLYPFESRRLNLDGQQYHYVDEGEGPPLLMVHGNPTWSFYYRGLIQAFRGRCRTVAPDHIGCGLSDKPAHYEYTLARHIENLQRLIEHLDLRNITLLAHDWGGAIGLGAAVGMPERFSRFVLFNTAAFRDTYCPLRIRACRIPVLGKIAVQGFNAFAGSAIHMATAKPERFTPEVKAGYLAPYDSWAHRIATHRFVLDIPLSSNHPSYLALKHVEDGLSKFRRHPVQLIWGMQDWCFTPHFLERFEREFFPQAEAHRLADAGHYVVEDAHERVVKLVEGFLARHHVVATPNYDQAAAEATPDGEPIVNVARRLTENAGVMPESLAVVAPKGYDESRKRVYDRITFSQLDRVSDRLSRGLRDMGAPRGARLVLMTPPGVHFIALTFALFKAGMTAVLIDPGMGRKNLLKCLDEIEPEGFIGVPKVHLLRRFLRRRYPKAKYNVVVGKKGWWNDAVSFDHLRGGPWSGPELAPTKREDPAAIIFTTGSTGPPKGVLYRHGNFDAQVVQIRDFYGIRPHTVNLPGFPLFGLFDAAMGVTTVVPDMDPTRPAEVDPLKIIEAVEDWKVTQAFGSPAMWNRVGRYCEESGIRLRTLKRVLSAGAPVPAHVLQRMKNAIHPDGDVHTPYGATESLPVASIAASEVLGETQARTAEGRGVCVGRRFPGIEWKVIEIAERPIGSLAEVRVLRPGEIGELIVRGAVVTTEYFHRPDATAWAKIPALAEVDAQASREAVSTTDSTTDLPPVERHVEGDQPPSLSRIDDACPPGDFWHRMGDVGYFDGQGRFWFCGRMAHRVLTASGPMYTIPCEAIFNEHPDVYRSALVGVGPAGKQRPVVVVEPHPGKFPRSANERERFRTELRGLAAENSLTASIESILFHPKLPTDIRHNSKIFREQLAVWAAGQVKG